MHCIWYITLTHLKSRDLYITKIMCVTSIIVWECTDEKWRVYIKLYTSLDSVHFWCIPSVFTSFSGLCSASPKSCNAKYTHFYDIILLLSENDEKSYTIVREKFTVGYFVKIVCGKIFLYLGISNQIFLQWISLRSNFLFRSSQT